MGKSAAVHTRDGNISCRNSHRNDPSLPERSIVRVEPGQRWVSKSGTDGFIIRCKSLLLVGWWTVESTSGGARTTIDEPTLLAEFDRVGDFTPRG